MNNCYKAIILLDVAGNELGRAEICDGFADPKITATRDGVIDCLMMCLTDGSYIVFSAQALRVVPDTKLYEGDDFSIQDLSLTCNGQTINLTPCLPLRDGHKRSKAVVQALRKFVGLPGEKKE